MISCLVNPKYFVKKPKHDMVSDSVYFVHGEESGGVTFFNKNSQMLGGRL